MIECQKLGLTKSIGVSNFCRRQLQTLIDDTSVIPANLQVCIQSRTGAVHVIPGSHRISFLTKNWQNGKNLTSLWKYCFIMVYYYII